MGARTIYYKGRIYYFYGIYNNERELQQAIQRMRRNTNARYLIRRYRKGYLMPEMISLLYFTR